MDELNENTNGIREKKSWYASNRAKEKNVTIIITKTIIAR